MASFFRAIDNDLNKAAGFVGGLLHEGLNDVESFGKSAEHYMESAKDQAFQTAGHVISGGEDIIKDGINTGGDIVKGGENIIAIPLILLAGGLALFMLSGNAGKAIDVGGKLGSQAMKNPEMFM